MALFGLLPQGAMGMVNQVFNPATQAAPQQAAMQQNAFQPSPIGIPGMLGIKGGFRDALGSIGDALLIANNADPMYGPAKQKQQLDHAMQGFADNPMEAIKRVAAIDPALGREMYMKQIEADQKAEKARLDGTKTQFDIRKEALGVMGGLVGAVNEATFGPIQQRLLELDRDAGLGLADVIRGARTPEELQTVAQAAITADQRADNERDQMYKTERLEDFDAAEARQQANTNSMISSRSLRDGLAVQRANRPRGGGSPRRGGGSSSGGGATRVVAGRTFREVSPGKWKPE